MEKESDKVRWIFQFCSRTGWLGCRVGKERRVINQKIESLCRDLRGECNVLLWLGVPAGAMHPTKSPSILTQPPPNAIYTNILELTDSSTGRLVTRPEWAICTVIKFKLMTLLKGLRLHFSDAIDAHFMSLLLLQLHLICWWWG